MHTTHRTLPAVHLRGRNATSLIELMVSIVIASVLIAMTLPAITSGTRLERRTTAKLTSYDTARPVLDLLHQRLTRTGRGLVVAQPDKLTWRSADDARKRCQTLWLDGSQLRYRVTSAAATAADPLCPSEGADDPYTVLAEGVSLRSGTPLFRYEDEPSVPSAAGQETLATRVLVGFQVGEGGEAAYYRRRAVTVGR